MSGLVFIIIFIRLKFKPKYYMQHYAYLRRIYQEILKADYTVYL